MKLLWVVHTIFPELSNALGKPYPVGGGWMYGLANDVIQSGISLTVVTARKNEKEFSGTIKGINYHLLKGQKTREWYDPSLIPKWKKLIEQESPDLVHIHGTEYAHGLALMNACPELKYVISIQGMTSIYSRYYLGGISNSKILANLTIRDIIKADSLWQAQARFKKRGDHVEIPMIRKARHIIGRTQWDHDHVKTFNPECTYHFCNESLRDVFYESRKWNIAAKSEYTIFLSQAGYPIKGLHKVLEAVRLISDTFPQIKLRIARNNIAQSTTLKDKLRMTGYGKYISSLVRKFGLEDHITFTGPLDADQMAEEYLNCHVFICPSSIENSPNSLGEAQILGVPCISSYVGGVQNMVEHEETGLLYRFEEVEMLAQAITRLFTDEKLALELSEKSAKAALKRHDRQTNVRQLVNIYESIQQ